ncbi:MAG: hypothetical protein ACI9G1_005402 [Pirellulaceae bacterium]|jgi:hypothetical protein
MIEFIRLLNVVALLVLVAGLALIVFWSTKAPAVLANYPPISDEEFLARCSPGVNPKMALRVREIVAVQLGIDYERVCPELKFADF